MFLLRNCIILSVYATFADISLAPNGFRRLVLNGFRFGERGASSGVQFWQCTANTRDIETGKSRRCPARIKTKIILGYEMIRDANGTYVDIILCYFGQSTNKNSYIFFTVLHIHPRPENI